MARLRPASPFAPPLAYTGDQERLIAEREEILSKLRRVPERSPFRPALQRSFTRVTAQLVAISQAPAPIPGSTRKDLQ